MGTGAKLRHACAPLLLAAAAALPACSIEVRSHGGNFTWGEPKAQRVEESALDLAAGGTLRLIEGCGDVRVTVAPEGAHLRAHFKGWGDDTVAAEAALARASLERSVRGGALELRVRLDELPSGTGARVDFDLGVPPDVALELDASVGAIDVEGPVRSVRAVTRFGDVTLRDVAGDARGSSSSGAVTLVAIGGEADARSQFGDVEVRDARGARVVARTQSGDARASGGGQARYELDSAFGDVELAGGGGEAVLGTRSGALRVRDFAGRVEARNSFGDIDLAGALTAVDAQTQSGRVTLRAPLPGAQRGEHRLVSKFGDVEVIDAHGLEGRLFATTGFGEVRCDLPLAETTTHREQRIEGTLGAGGALLHLETSSGDVLVRGVR